MGTVKDLDKKRLQLLQRKLLDAVGESADFFSLGPYVIYYKVGDRFEVWKCGDELVEIVFVDELQS